MMIVNTRSAKKPKISHMSTSNNYEQQPINESTEPNETNKSILKSILTKLVLLQKENKVT